MKIPRSLEPLIEDGVIHGDLDAAREEAIRRQLGRDQANLA